MIDFSIVSTKHDYGDPGQPLSYDYVNFYQGLKGSSEFNVSFIDYLELTELPRSGVKKHLNTKTIYFAVFFDDISLSNLINNISKNSFLMLFVHDISFRASELEKWISRVDIFVVSEDFRKVSLPSSKVLEMGFPVNTQVYRPIARPKKYDLCFIGSYHPYREWLLSKLKECGYKIYCAGRGWDGSKGVTTELMVQVFSESHIVLNLSNSISWDVRYLLNNPRGLINTIRSNKNGEQLKARVFEVSACRAFQISYFSFGISKYFSSSNELPMFSDDKEMLDMVDYFISNKDLREKISISSYEKTLGRYSAERWFLKLFEKVDGI